MSASRSIIDTFFVGPCRTGTTKMIDLLSKHPEVSTSVPKELKYFCINYKEEYNLFGKYPKSDADRKMIYCSPFYATMSYVRDRIYHHNPNAKIIMGVRDPIKRIISHWGIFQHTMPIGRVDTFWKEMELNAKLMSFDRFRSERDFVPHCNSYDSSYAVQYIEGSMYYTNFVRYGEYFKNVLVYDLHDGIEKNYKSVCEFIGIEHGTIDPRPVHDMSKYTGDDLYQEYYDEFHRRYPEIVHLLGMERKCIEPYIRRVS